MRSLSSIALVLLACSSGLVACMGPRSARAAQSAKQADVEPRMEVVALRYAVASDTANVLSSALAKTPVRIQADTHTNSLILVGPPKSVANALELIARLDVEAK